MSTGERMKIKRIEHKIPVSEIAKAMGVSIASVYRYENGDIEKVPGNMLEPLAKVLHTTPAYLMGWDDVEEASNTTTQKTYHAPKSTHDRLDRLNEANLQKVAELIDLFLNSQDDQDKTE